MKTLTKLGFGLIVLCIISCNWSSNNGKNKTAGPEQCITTILSIDDSLGAVRNHACELLPLSESIDNYVNGLHNLDFSGCPEAFKQAFESHIQAWVKLTKITDGYPEKRGEMHNLFDELSQTKDSVLFKQHVAEVWSTWSEIEEAKKQAERNYSK